MTAWQAFGWTLRSLLFDKGAVVPAVAGVIAYCFFYPLPICRRSCAQSLS
jgi:hypothetical protein